MKYVFFSNAFEDFFQKFADTIKLCFFLLFSFLSVWNALLQKQFKIEVLLDLKSSILILIQISLNIFLFLILGI